MAKKANETDGKKGFLVGSLLGAVTGAVAGLLLAPKSGEETRADIIKAVHKGNTELAKATHTAQKELGKRADELKKVIQDLGGKLDGDAKELLVQAQQYKADLVKKTAEIVASGKELSESANKDARKLIDDGMKLAGQLDKIIQKNANKLSEAVSAESAKLTTTKPAVKKPVSKTATQKSASKPTTKKSASNTTAKKSSAKK